MSIKTTDETLVPDAALRAWRSPRKRDSSRCEQAQQQGQGGSSHSMKAGRRGARGKRRAVEAAVGTGPLLAQFSASDHSVHPGR